MTVISMTNTSLLDRPAFILASSKEQRVERAPPREWPVRKISHLFSESEILLQKRE